MSDSQSTRASLILRLRRPEDAAAWAEFIEIYQPLIYRLARSKGLQEADALDLTQEVLSRVATTINRFDPDPERGSFRGWLSQVTRNLVIDFLRGQQRRPRTSDETSIRELLDQTPDGPETDWYNAEHQRQVFAWAADKIQDSFQPTTWKAFWFTAVDQLSAQEAADKLGITAGAVYIARSRVMARLKDKVQQHSIQIEPGGRR